MDDELKKRKIDEDVVINPPKQKKTKATDAENKLNAKLPQPPFFTIIVGPRHRGKSHLLLNLLSKVKGMYGSFFKRENVVMFSPTYLFDKTLHELKLDHVYTDSQETPITWIVSEIKQKQDEYREANNMAPVLLVLEDITKIKNAWTALEDLGYTGRHYNIHVLAIAHKMSSIPRGVRTQTQQWILYKPNEQSEWDWVLNMFARKSTQKLWMTVLQRVWKKPYNFVHIDFERQEFSEIYREGFNVPMFTEAEEKQMENPEIKKVDLFYNPEYEQKE